jgi:hypothetical protein
MSKWLGQQPVYSLVRMSGTCKLWKRLCDILLLHYYHQSQVLKEKGVLLVRLNRLQPFEKLTLCKNTVKDKHVRRLRGLKQLSIRRNSILGSRAISSLTNLTSLHIKFSYRQYFLPDTLLKLTNLTDLVLIQVPQILSKAPLFEFLTNLTSLNLAHINDVDDKDLSCLTNLHTLSLSAVAKVSDRSIAALTNLTSLLLEFPENTNAALSPLTNLTHLRLVWASDITRKAFCSLTNITSLSFDKCRSLDRGIFSMLPLTPQHDESSYLEESSG